MTETELMRQSRAELEMMEGAVLCTVKNPKLRIFEDLIEDFFGKFYAIKN